LPSTRKAFISRKPGRNWTNRASYHICFRREDMRSQKCDLEVGVLERRSFFSRCLEFLTAITSHSNHFISFLRSSQSSGRLVGGGNRDIHNKATHPFPTHLIVPSAFHCTLSYLCINRPIDPSTHANIARLNCRCYPAISSAAPFPLSINPSSRP
jgi:hypothetical protein